MSPGKTIALAAFLFAAPVCVVGILHHEELADAMHVEASEAQGKLLFFTAPSR